MPGGYCWWYVDALSEDGTFGLSIIAFIGSVFSPYYRWNGWRDPLDHCAVNVALYGPRGSHWAMTERSSGRVSRTRDTLAIGSSHLEWRDECLEIDIDEICVPFPKRIRGHVQIAPIGINEKIFGLNGCGRHFWRPIAPRARVIVDLERPNLGWRGDGYFDMNEGIEPLENGFHSWTWSRGVSSRGTTLLYDVHRRDGTRNCLAMRFDAKGQCEVFAPPPVARLPSTRWLVARESRADDGAARVERVLEDAPFYSRSVISSTVFGERIHSIHESVSLTRFSHPIVQFMLPFRMPRRG
jgi:carotenoid 1,2-hydratase